MTLYTVVGLVDRATNELEIAGVIRGHVVIDNAFENVESTRWFVHMFAGDPYEAESLAHELHEFGGIPAEHAVGDLPLDSVIVHDTRIGSRIRALALAGDVVEVWFDGDDGLSEPARYPATEMVRAVLPTQHQPTTTGDHHDRRTGVPGPA